MVSLLVLDVYSDFEAFAQLDRPGTGCREDQHR